MFGRIGRSLLSWVFMLCKVLYSVKMISCDRADTRISRLDLRLWLGYSERLDRTQCSLQPCDMYSSICGCGRYNNLDSLLYSNAGED
jgi:hypothetical protein